MIIVEVGQSQPYCFRCFLFQGIENAALKAELAALRAGQLFVADHTQAHGAVQQALEHDFLEFFGWILFRTIL